MTGLKLILDPSPLNALVITSSWHWAKKSNTSVLLVLVATINYPHHLDHHPPDYGRGSQQEEGLEGPPSTSKVTRNHLVGQPRGQFSHLMHDVGLLCLKLNYLSRACGWKKHQFLISIHPSITNSSILPFIFLWLWSKLELDRKNGFQHPNPFGLNRGCCSTSGFGPGPTSICSSWRAQSPWNGLYCERILLLVPLLQVWEGTHSLRWIRKEGIRWERPPFTFRVLTDSP